MEIAPTAKRAPSVAAVSIPPVVLDRERAQSKVVRYGNRTYGETNVTRSGFHTAGHAWPGTCAKQERAIWKSHLR